MYVKEKYLFREDGVTKFTFDVAKGVAAASMSPMSTIVK